MPEILTTNFKTDSTRLFVDDVLNNDYYLFVSGIDRLNSENTLYSTNEFLEKVLFGKKVVNQDVHFMIKYYPWQRGQVYVQYDDRVDLENQKFYAIVGPNDNDTGDYRVYKCLSNNLGAEVSNPPNYNVDATDQIYRTADGYVWKYMYALSVLEFDAYNSLGYIPITGIFDTNPTANTGGSELSAIAVENPEENFGYSEVTGNLIQTPFSTGVLIGRPSTAGVFSPILNYYTGQSIYLTNSNGVTNIFTITYYFYNSSTGNVQINVDGNPVTAGVASNASFKIFPRVEILGDGTGAKAIPNIVDGSITSITILDKGNGYNNVVTRVVDPSYDFDPEDPATTDARVSIRGVLTPRDGHATNLLDEFKCKHFGIYVYITAEDNLQIGRTNTYSSVGIIRNPEFTGNTSPAIFDNRIAITTGDVSAVEVNTIVNQVNANNEIVFSAKVHEVDLSSNTIYLAEYAGPYPNYGNTHISLDTSLPLRNETGQTIQINTPVENNIVRSEYIQRTGKLYFMEDFFPLARTDDSREEYKFVLEF